MWLLGYYFIFSNKLWGKKLKFPRPKRKEKRKKETQKLPKKFQQN
jgi:hypothetical protein